MNCAYRNCDETLPEPRNPRRIYCSQRCAHGEWTQRYRDVRKAHPDYRLDTTAICDADNCDETFRVTTPNKRYCSRECSQKTNTQAQQQPDRQCRVCGVAMKSKSKRAFYCSPGCSVQGKAALRSLQEWHKRSVDGLLPSLDGREIRKCEGCGDLMVPRSASQRFCRYCRNAARRASTKNVDVKDAVKVWESDSCAGCGLPFDPSSKGTSPVLDHDHKTNRVRGKLHSNCNLAIGLLKDDPIRIIRLGIYLQEQSNMDVS